MSCACFVWSSIKCARMLTNFRGELLKPAISLLWGYCDTFTYFSGLWKGEMIHSSCGLWIHFWVKFLLVSSSLPKESWEPQSLYLSGSLLTGCLKDQFFTGELGPNPTLHTQNWTAGPKGCEGVLGATGPIVLSSHNTNWAIDEIFNEGAKQLFPMKLKTGVPQRKFQRCISASLFLWRADTSCHDGKEGRELAFIGLL